MKMFVVNAGRKGKFTIEKGLRLAYAVSGKKNGFAKFWIASIADDVSVYKKGVYLAKDIQKTLPEFPEKFTEVLDIIEETKIDDVKLVKHPTIDGKWMAVHNEDNRAMVFFSRNVFDTVFPITESLEFVEKDCPHNHRCTCSIRYDGSYDESRCAICGSKLIKRHDDKSFFRLAEKHGIEIGNGKEMVCNFIHVHDGKINVLTTNCSSLYELAVEAKYNSYSAFELTPKKKTLIGASTDYDNLYILSILFNGTDIELNVERKLVTGKDFIFDFTYESEKEYAEYTLKKLIESRKKSNLVLKDSTHSIEDSPFAILKNMKFD